MYGFRYYVYGVRNDMYGVIAVVDRVIDDVNDFIMNHFAH